MVAVTRGALRKDNSALLDGSAVDKPRQRTTKARAAEDQALKERLAKLKQRKAPEVLAPPPVRAGVGSTERASTPGRATIRIQSDAATNTTPSLANHRPISPCKLLPVKSDNAPFRIAEKDTRLPTCNISSLHGRLLEAQKAQNSFGFWVGCELGAELVKFLDGLLAQPVLEEPATPDHAHRPVTLATTKQLAEPAVLPRTLPAAIPSALPTAPPIAAPTALPAALPRAAPNAPLIALPKAVPTAVPNALANAPPKAPPHVPPAALPIALPPALPIALPVRPTIKSAPIQSDPLPATRPPVSSTRSLMPASTPCPKPDRPRPMLSTCRNKHHDACLAAKPIAAIPLAAKSSCTVTPRRPLASSTKHNSPLPASPLRAEATPSCADVTASKSLFGILSTPVRRPLTPVQTTQGRRFWPEYTMSPGLIPRMRRKLASLIYAEKAFAAQAAQSTGLRAFKFQLDTLCAHGFDVGQSKSDPSFVPY